MHRVRALEVHVDVVARAERQLERAVLDLALVQPAHDVLLRRIAHADLRRQRARVSRELCARGIFGEAAHREHARRRVGLGDDERGLLDDEAALEVEDGGLLARLHLEAPEGHRALRRGDVVGGPSRRASVRRVDTPPRQGRLAGCPGAARARRRAGAARRRLTAVYYKIVTASVHNSQTCGSLFLCARLCNPARRAAPEDGLRSVGARAEPGRRRGPDPQVARAEARRRREAPPPSVEGPRPAKEK